MTYRTRTVRCSKAGLTQEQALEGLYEHPGFDPSAMQIVGIRQAGQHWIAKLKIAEFPPAPEEDDGGGEEESAPPKKTPKPKGESPFGEDDGDDGDEGPLGPSDGPPGLDDAGSEGDGEDGPPKGKGGEKAEIGHLLHLVQQIADALGIGGDLGIPGAEDPSLSGPGGPPGLGGPPGGPPPPHKGPPMGGPPGGPGGPPGAAGKPPPPGPGALPPSPPLMNAPAFSSRQGGVAPNTNMLQGIQEDQWPQPGIEGGPQGQQPPQTGGPPTQQQFAPGTAPAAAGQLGLGNLNPLQTPGVQTPNPYTGQGASGPLETEQQQGFRPEDLKGGLGVGSMLGSTSPVGRAASFTASETTTMSLKEAKAELEGLYSQYGYKVRQLREARVNGERVINALLSVH